MPDFDKFVEGRPGQSNWPGSYFEKHGRKAPKLQEILYFIDVEGETMSRATTSKGAMIEAKNLQRQFPGAKVLVRPYKESEEDADQAYQDKKEKQWLDMVYKPSPARRMK